MDINVGQKFKSVQLGSNKYIIYSIIYIYKDQVELLILDTFPVNTALIGHTTIVGIDTIRLMLERERFELVVDSSFEIET